MPMKVIRPVVVKRGHVVTQLVEALRYKPGSIPDDVIALT
jgi:hypothetical protein